MDPDRLASPSTLGKSREASAFGNKDSFRAHARSIFGGKRRRPVFAFLPFGGKAGLIERRWRGTFCAFCADMSG